MTNPLLILIPVLLFQLVLALYLMYSTRRRNDEKPKRKRKNDEFDRLQQATGLKSGYVVAGEIKIPFGDERKRVLALHELRREEERHHPPYQWKNEDERKRVLMEYHAASHVPEEPPIPFSTNKSRR